MARISLEELTAGTVASSAVFHIPVRVGDVTMPRIPCLIGQDAKRSGCNLVLFFTKAVLEARMPRRLEYKVSWCSYVVVLTFYDTLLVARFGGGAGRDARKPTWAA